MYYQFHKAYETIDDMVKAVKKQEVKGMLIDRLMAVYYERQDKLGSLLTAREFSVQKKVSVIFVQELKGFVDCLAVLRPAIDTAVEDITSTYKVGSYTVGRTSSTFGKFSWKHSKSFVFLLSNQKLA